MAQGKKMGRPSVFTDELAGTICVLTADGMSLRKICELDKMPDRETVRQWFITNPDFLGQYTRAKEEQADYYADVLTDMADSVLTGEYDPASARVAADIYKWTASKLKPKKYGDKIDHTTNGKDMPTPIISLPPQA